MAEVIIKETAVETESVAEEVKKPKIDSSGRAYATGKRKNAVARVWIKKGKGSVVVNGKKAEEYFGREILTVLLNQPFGVTENANKFDVVATVKGGGLSGQAGAVCHGISKALDMFDPSSHTILRRGGFLTRDSRVVERKKYGLKKARKGPTYRKR